MADISKFILPDNAEINVKDSTARQNAANAVSALLQKVNVNQGLGNVGKILGIGNDGKVTPMVQPTYESKEASEGGTDVSLVTTGEKAAWNAKTSNVGTITGIKMNGASKGTSGVVDLGTVLTSHQDISGKANTSDIPTKVSDLENDAGYLTQHQSLDGKLDTTLKGASGGLAELDENGKVPSSQLPSYVDDVLEYSSQSAFPLSGESGKVYIAQDTNITYRWGGSAYVPIGSDLALGETSSTAYRGDRGKAAYDHAQAKGSAFTSGLYKITTNAEGHVTAATKVTKTDITGLGIPESDTTYESKPASEGGTDVSLVTTGEKAAWNAKTSNAGTVTGVKMNNGNAVSPDANGVVDLGTVLTSHQDISGKANTSDIPTKVSDLENDSGYLTQHQSLDGKANKSEAIKNITRSGTTFTATKADGTTFTFDQQDNNTTYSFSDNNVTLAWGTRSTIATVGGTDIHVTMPNNPDTNTWRGIQNNLTSTSTSDSLSAYQGKVLNDKIDATIHKNCNTNGWTNGSEYSCYVVGHIGFITINGAKRGTTDSTWSTCYTLPSGVTCRKQVTGYMAMDSLTNGLASVAECRVTTAGNVQIYAPQAGYVYWGTIVFPAN